MGKTRDLFKKIRDTKGIFNAKIDIRKDLKEILQTQKKQKTAYEIDHCDWSSDVSLPISSTSFVCSDAS